MTRRTAQFNSALDRGRPRRSSRHGRRHGTQWRDIGERLRDTGRCRDGRSRASERLDIVHSHRGRRFRGRRFRGRRFRGRERRQIIDRAGRDRWRLRGCRWPLSAIRLRYKWHSRLDRSGARRGGGRGRRGRRNGPEVGHCLCGVPQHIRRSGSRRLGSRRLGSRRLGSRRLGNRRLSSRRLGSRPRRIERRYVAECGRRIARPRLGRPQRRQVRDRSRRRISPRCRVVSFWPDRRDRQSRPALHRLRLASPNIQGF